MKAPLFPNEAAILECIDEISVVRVFDSKIIEILSALVDGTNQQAYELERVTNPFLHWLSVSIVYINVGISVKVAAVLLL